MAARILDCCKKCRDWDCGWIYKRGDMHMGLPWGRRLQRFVPWSGSGLCPHFQNNMLIECRVSIHYDLAIAKVLSLTMWTLHSGYASLLTDTMPAPLLPTAGPNGGARRGEDMLPCNSPFV
jgi:hypothetical protein